MVRVCQSPRYSSPLLLGKKTSSPFWWVPPLSTASPGVLRITAVSLPLYGGHLCLTGALINHEALAGCSPLVNSLHAAARRESEDGIAQFVQEFELGHDIEEKDEAAPAV